MSEGNYINILGDEISFSNERIDIYKLKFYEKNPRVLSKLTRAGKLNVAKEEKQSVIKKEMQFEPSVQKLLKSIPKASGITEPLIVQQSTLEVLEGNSRLATVLILADKNEDEVDRYLSVPCQLVTLNEEQIDALLDQLHIEGKTSWTTYDKAYASYQRVMVDGVDIKDYADRITATENEINKRVNVIQLMMNENMDDKPDRFSYYEQFVRSTKLKSALELNNELMSYLLSEIKKDEPSFTAAEMRDDFPQIAMKPKTLKKLIHGSIDFETAKEYAKPSTPKRYVAKALGYLKEVNRKDLTPLNSNDRNSLNIEVRKCRKEIQRIDDILSSNQDQ